MHPPRPQHLSARRRTSSLALGAPVLLGAAVALTWACAESVAPPNTAPPTAAATPPLRDGSGGGCGVSFSAVVTAEDELLDAYGIPATTDTVQVCETWTGNDYVLEETTVGSAYNAYRAPDSARTVVYSGGTVQGYAADGGPAHEAVSVGPTAFDFMQVDEGTRQASYDDPYWAVYSDGNGNPCPPPQIVCSVATPGDTLLASGAVAGAPATASASPVVREFKRHGPTVRGVRALVDDATEVGRSPEGHRRFKKRRGGADVVLTLDKATGLLIAEETTAGDRVTKASHTWKPHPRGGFARERTVVEALETIDGRAVRSRTTITMSNLTLGTGTVLAAAAPTRSEARP